MNQNTSIPAAQAGAYQRNGLGRHAPLIANMIAVSARLPADKF
jgi:hypothetical protein